MISRIRIESPDRARGCDTLGARLFAALLPILVCGGAAPSGRSVEFNRDIRPILSENCYACHGPDKSHRKAELRLDIRESALEKEAIVPGKADESELVARVLSQDPDEVMPPPKSHKTLSPAQKELLRRWVEAGAEYQAHWAYVPPRRGEIPAVKQTGWVQNPID